MINECKCGCSASSRMIDKTLQYIAIQISDTQEQLEEEKDKRIAYPKMDLEQLIYLNGLKDGLNRVKHFLEVHNQ